MHDNPTQPAIEDVLAQEIFAPAPEATPEREPGADTNDFPLDALPAYVADMVSMVSEVVKVPLALAAICALGAASASLGKGIVVKFRSHLSTMGNLYIIGIAESGSGKSQALQHFIAVIHAIQKELQKKFRTEIKPLLKAKLELLNQQSAKSSKGHAASSNADVATRAEAIREVEEIEAMLESQPQYVCDDVTTEKLGKILQRQAECQFSCSPDARNAIKNLCGRYRDRGETDEGIYLMAYSGDPITINRVGSGDIFLEKPCIEIMWLVQPDKGRELFSNDALNDSGLVPRCLVANTNARRQPRDVNERPFDLEISGRYGRAIESIFRAYRLSSDTAPRVVTPEPDAAEAMRVFYNSTISEQYADIGSYAARYEENANKIALVLHALEHGVDADKRELSIDTANNAIRIQKFFIKEQLQLLSAGRQVKRNKKKDKLLEVIAKKFGDTKAPVLRTEAYQYANMDRDTAFPLLDELEAEGRIQKFETKPTHGPKYTAYAPK